MRASLIALLFLLTACSPEQPPDPLIGGWLKSQADDAPRQIIIFDADGQLHLLGFDDLQGGTWQETGKDTGQPQLQLTLTARSQALTLAKQAGYTLDNHDQLTLNGEHRLAGDYQRNHQVGLIAGEIQLPDQQHAGPGSILALTLEHAGGEQLGHQLMPLDNGDTRINYRFHFDLTTLDPLQPASLHARIIADGSALFVASEPVQIRHDRHTIRAPIQMTAIGAARRDSTPDSVPASSRDDTGDGQWPHHPTWKPIQLEDHAVKEGSPARLTFVGDNKVHGHLGCNRFKGRYQLDGERLSFSNISSTLMACRDGMQQEQAFSRILKNTNQWRLDDNQLQLLDGDKVLARLTAFDPPDTD